MDDEPPRFRRYPVHWFAATFPMLSDEDMQALALNIKKNGLIHPLMLDHEGEILLDGRNRTTACEMVAVEPRYERLPEGVDPIEYILSVNVERRQLNPGQRAIVWALAYPPEKGGRGKHSQIREGLLAGESLKSFQNRVSEAREVIAQDDLRRLVMSSSMAFDRAVQEARWRVQNAGKAEELLRRLEFEAPALAEEVTSGKASLYAACTVHRLRQKEAARGLKVIRQASLNRLQRFLLAWDVRLPGDGAYRERFAERFNIIEAERVEELLDELAGWIEKVKRAAD